MNQMLDSALKSVLKEIMHLIEDETINEIKVSQFSKGFGAIWVYRHGCWETAMNKRNTENLILPNQVIDSIISYMAGDSKKPSHEKSPILECAIPVLGYRFTGIKQPASFDCSKFNIRKYSTRLYTFEEYVEQGLFVDEEVEVIRDWQKRDIFTVAIAGSTNSGKTTFLNTYIDEKRKNKPNENWVIIEDSKDLNIRVGNVDRLLITNQIDMDDLLKVTLRLTPDNCVVGEVRGKEASTALELAKIKSVCFTMHAKDIDQALSRIERMILQHPDINKVSRQEIAENINAIISIQNVPYKRQDDSGNVIDGYRREVTQIQEIMSYDDVHQMYSVRSIK